MNDLLQLAARELVRFLNKELPELTKTWWQKLVVERLTPLQHRTVKERGFKSLQELDLAALLRVLDQNWHELSNKLGFPQEGRSWVRELQSVRIDWAHLPAKGMPATEVYRDADTLGRVLVMLGAEQSAIDIVDSTKATYFAVMAKAVEAVSGAQLIEHPNKGNVLTVGRDSTEMNGQDSWENLLDVVNCSDSISRVMKGVYTCPDTGGAYSHRRAKYFGPYKDKTVSCLFEIRAVVWVGKDLSSAQVKVNNVGSTNHSLVEEAGEKIRMDTHLAAAIKEKALLVFLLDKPAPTKFTKSTKYGMQGSKKYFRGIAEGCANSTDLAEKLKGKAWSDFE